MTNEFCPICEETLTEESIDLKEGADREGNYWCKSCVEEYYEKCL
jgi:hypothetical protein